MSANSEGCKLPARMHDPGETRDGQEMILHSHELYFGEEKQRVTLYVHYSRNTWTKSTGKWREGKEGS